MHYAKYHYPEWYYPEWHYPECHYPECCGAVQTVLAQPIKLKKIKTREEQRPMFYYFSPHDLHFADNKLARFFNFYSSSTPPNKLPLAKLNNLTSASRLGWKYLRGSNTLAYYTKA